MAVLLSHYHSPPGSSSVASGEWRLSPGSGLPSDRIVRAYCFAHPCTVSAKLAARCAVGSTPLVCSVTLGSDVICRLGPAPLREIRRTLGRLTELRRRRSPLGRRRRGKGDGEEKVAPSATDPYSQAPILRAWWRWKQLGGGQVTEAFGEVTRKIEELEDMAWRLRLSIEGEEGDDEATSTDAMFSPGTVFHIDRLPAHEESRRRRELDSTRADATTTDSESGGAAEDEAWSALYRVDDPAKFFRYPFLELDAITSHLPQQYLDAVENLS
jgi:hypothetical protein